MVETNQGNAVYVPLDIRRSQFGHYSKVDVKGTAICVIFTFIYLTFAIYFYSLLQFMLDTTSRSKPIIVEAVVYLVIIQKLVRVFVVKEKYMLDQYLKELASYNVSIAPFWNISPSGFKEVKTPYGTLTKVKYKNNKECVFIKLSKGARTRFSENSKQYNTVAIASALVHLNKTGYNIIHIDLPEFLDIVDAFKKYEQCILECEDNNQSIILSLFLDNILSETVTKGFISSEVYIIEAESATQKNKLDTVAFEFLSLFKDTTYIKNHIMNKNEILALVKEVFGLDVIDTTLITTENSTIDIPLGHTKVIALYDENNKLIKQVNKEYEGKMKEVNRIRFKTVAPTKKSSNKKVSTPSNKSSLLEKSTLSFEESSQKVEDILKIIQKLHTNYNIPEGSIDTIQVFKDLNIDLRYSESLLNLKNSIILGANNIPIIEDNKVTTLGKNLLTKKSVNSTAKFNNSNAKNISSKNTKSISNKNIKSIKSNKSLSDKVDKSAKPTTIEEVKNNKVKSTLFKKKLSFTKSEPVVTVDNNTGTTTGIKKSKKLKLTSSKGEVNKNKNVLKKKSMFNILQSKSSNVEKQNKSVKSTSKKSISHNKSKGSSKKKLSRKH